MAQGAFIVGRIIGQQGRQGMTIHVGILCGGRSGEHQVSLLSARSIYQALDRERFAPLLVAIDRRGFWHAGSADDLLEHPEDPARIALRDDLPRCWPMPDDTGGCRLTGVNGGDGAIPVDVFFPIVHGTDGEDGALQGMLRLLDRPFVGADVLGSAVGMDKDVMKRLLAHGDMPITPWRTLVRRDINETTWDALSAELGPVVFVKPACLGSSVGVSRVESAAEFQAAVAEALRYDRKVVVEAAVPGREIEVSVLGDGPGGDAPPRASLPGEIKPRHGFYSYAAKYLDPDGAALIIPAPLEDGQTEHVQALAVRAFQALDCEGMARVDFFLRPDGRFIINEINTLPGFTSISMYPKLWAASGLPYPALLTRLIELALARHARQRRLERNYAATS